MWRAITQNRFARAVFRTFQVLFIAGVALLMVGTAALCVYIFQIVSALPERLTSLRELEYDQIAVWKQHTEIYSDAARLRPGAALSRVRRRLVRLEYEPIGDDGEDGPGTYADEVSADGSGALTVHTRPFAYPRLQPVSDRYALHFEEGVLRSIERSDGSAAAAAHLEPELMAELYNTDDGASRRLISIEETPPHLVDAFLAVEDHEFYEHPGIHVRRLVVTMGTNVLRGQRHGASTITQQLARNILLDRGKTVPRKVREWALSALIERRFSKDQILERYLNFVDFGRRRNREMRGVQEAARLLFDKEPEELTLAECALLAALPNAPTRYSPIENPESSKRRRNFILRQMLRREYITEEEYREAAAAPVEVSSGRKRRPNNSAPYFTAHIKERLKRMYTEEDLFMRGLSVYTTLDPLLQEDAEAALQSGLKKLDAFLGYPDYSEARLQTDSGESPTPRLAEYVRGCVAAVEVESGRIAAMAGGRDWKYIQFNSVTQGRRQPGSAFKPIVFTAAWESGLKPEDTIIDEPWSLDGWTPENYDRNEYRGEVTLEEALIRSLNIPTARLLNERLGTDAAARTARRLGIESPIGPHPSVSLGTAEVTPLELTAAYAAFANGGYRVEPIDILYVTELGDPRRIVDQFSTQRTRAVAAESAETTRRTLQGVLDDPRGTARRARTEFQFAAPAAGKTGTTSGYADAWFVGFTPKYAAGVWIGFDNQNKKTRRTGSQGAMPIWADFMKAASEEPHGEFSEPSAP